MPRGATVMGDKTEISWTDSTWNPVKGCSRISPGCGGANHEGGCYAEKIAARFSGPGLPFHGFAEKSPWGGRWTGKLALASEHVLGQPLRWKRPRRIFVNSMSDLFHENLSFRDIAYVFHIMTGEASYEPAPEHIYQILTKRAGRMRQFFEWLAALSDNEEAVLVALRDCYRYGPPRRVWLGVSVEDQERADERIPDLLATPATVRFLSCEPLLGSLDLSPWLETMGKISWAIIGAESGPRARPFDLSWARSLRDQCVGANVACFVKQLGQTPRNNGNGWDVIRLKHRAGADPAEWPADLRVQEFPA